MIALPQRPDSPNVSALASYTREEFTGLTTAVVTLSAPANSGTECVVKNGAVVRPSTYTIAGTTLTLGSALIAGDWVVVWYHARPT